MRWTLHAPLLSMNELCCHDTICRFTAGVTMLMQALQDTGVKGRPQDYLMFFALVNREIQRPDEAQQPPQRQAHGLQVSLWLLV